MEELCSLTETGANCSEEEVQKTIDRVNQTYPAAGRRGLLLNALCGASVNGLEVKKMIEGFRKVAEKLNVDECQLQNIFDLYVLESELKEKYIQFYCYEYTQ